MVVCTYTEIGFLMAYKYHFCTWWSKNWLLIDYFLMIWFIYWIWCAWVSVFTFLTCKTWLTFTHKSITVWHAMTHIHTLYYDYVSKNMKSKTIISCLITGLGVQGSQISHLEPVKPGRQVHIKFDPIAVHWPPFWHFKFIVFKLSLIILRYGIKHYLVWLAWILFSTSWALEWWCAHTLELGSWWHTNTIFALNLKY